MDGIINFENTPNVINFEGPVSNTSEDQRVRPISIDTLKPGVVLFYDVQTKQYGVVDQNFLASVLASDNERYETNGDIFKGIIDGVAHFGARFEAYSQEGMYQSDAAATACYYRIEIDNTQAGSITFSATSGNASIASTTIDWEANEDMATIVAKFVAKNASYLTFAALADGHGVGLSAGGYEANTMTVTASTNCTVIDCSGLAYMRSENPAAPGVGGTMNPDAAFTFIAKGTHHNWRGATAATCLPGRNLVGASDVLIANDGYDYGYRVGINYAKFLAWATTGGDDTYYDDGEGGTDDSKNHVMRKSRFDTEVTNYTGEDSHRLGMKAYYTHLFTDQTGEYAELRFEYEARYKAQMTSMYDAYIMSHMIKLDALTGITALMRNNGLHQTQVKADAMNVTYDYEIVPAYPPEYNAQHYGIAKSEGFAPGKYAHEEPATIGLTLRDDVMAAFNVTIDIIGSGTKISNANGVYGGTCADYDAIFTCNFNGAYGILGSNLRYNGYFRSRPDFAYSLN